MKCPPSRSRTRWRCCPRPASTSSRPRSRKSTAAATPAEPAKTAVVAAEATGEDEELGRTDDPVRMYLREMGSVELLSREGEIEIAKRIEAGQDKMIGGICESPMTITALLHWRDAINEGRILLRDVIDLEATQGGAPRRGQGRHRRAAPPRRPMPRPADAEAGAPGCRRRRRSMARCSRRGSGRRRRRRGRRERAVALGARGEAQARGPARPHARSTKVYIEMSKVQNRRLSTLEPRPEAQRRLREELREAPQEDRRAGAHGAYQRQPHRAAQALALRPQPQADDAGRQAAADWPKASASRARTSSTTTSRTRSIPTGSRRSASSRARAGRTSPRSRRPTIEKIRAEIRRSPSTPARRSSSSAACARPCRTASAR